MLNAQTTTEIEGVSKITNASEDNSSEDLLVLKDDGTIAIRKVNTLGNQLSNFPGNINETIRHDGSNWISNSLLFNTGNRIGISNTNPQFLLDVNGDIRIGKPSIDLGGQVFKHDTKIITNSGYTIFRLLLDGLDASQTGNMFFGSNGPDKLVGGSYANIGIGGFTFRKLNIGYGNIAIGNASQSRTTDGNLNTSLGSSSMFSNVTGNQNVAIGANAGYNSKGDRNIFIGYQAGLNETGSDKLYIQNISTSKPLIYGEFDSRKIELDGSVHISQILNLQPTSEPSNPVEGAVYYDGTLKKLRLYNGTSWENLN